MASINPTRDAIAQLMTLIDPDKPVTMLNLLRYNEQARYPEGSDAHPVAAARLTSAIPAPLSASCRR